LQKQLVSFKNLGIMGYKNAWDVQEDLLAQNITIKQQNRLPNAVIQPTNHHLLFCQHPHVYTLGKSGKKEHVLITDAELQQKQIEFFNTNRGGDITYHGPGQLVGYPILDLELFYTDIGKYLRNIEQVVIDTLAEYGITSGRSKGETGVWLDADVPGKERKICAIGVRCSRWVTMHGFALNINTNLNYFNYIVPCGIQNKQVTSMQQELGVPVDFNLLQEKLKKHFEAIFNVILQ
jgi:lipoyl(octanoyl) transferase